MKIAANLGVKDEVELIGLNIAHLRAIGVDLIITFDMGSTDGTLEYLEQQASRDDFRLIRMDDRKPDSGESWLRHNLEEVQAAGVDWAIFLDADEFWLPVSGSLKDCEALQRCDLLSVDRFNVPLAPGETAVPSSMTPDRYDELLLLAKPISNFREYMEKNPHTAWSSGVPMPKVMVRPAEVAAMTYGMHDVIPQQPGTLRRCKPKDLLIAHLPFSTVSRFARKVENIRALFAVHDKQVKGHTAWHWRRWLALTDPAAVAMEFDKQRVEPQAFAELRSSGVIRSAGEIFRARAASPAS